MVHASDISYSYSLQPSSSRDEEAVERAFWQSTPTSLEGLRQGTEDERHHAVSMDQDRPNDPLSLSTQQSRLIRQTWASAAGTPGGIGRISDGKTQTSSRPKYRNRRGEAARPDSTNVTSASTVSSTDKSTTRMFFGHLKNIEKVSKTVDERMQKRKVQMEWSTKVISDTARLRDEEGGLKENMNTNMQHDASNDDDNDSLGLGTPQSDDDGASDPESMEEEVPTSQSQERYLSLSQISPTGSLGAPNNGSTDQRQPPRCAGDF